MFQHLSKTIYDGNINLFTVHYTYQILINSFFALVLVKELMEIKIK